MNLCFFFLQTEVTVKANWLYGDKRMSSAIRSGSFAHPLRCWLRLVFQVPTTENGVRRLEKLEDRRLHLI